MTLSAIEILEAARTLLFVPGDRPERFAKASASGAALVVVDLEDAVAPAEKPLARQHVERWLADGHPGAVRVNAHGTDWHEGDLAAVADHDCVVVVPKAESPDVLSEVARQVGTGVLALVESAAGVLGAQGIAAAPGVQRLAVGAYDLAAELGVSPDDRDAMAWSRGALVLASAAAGIAPPVDGITGDVEDEERLRSEVQHAARMGFTGKLCIHPRQVGVVEDCCVPPRKSCAGPGQSPRPLPTPLWFSSTARWWTSQWWTGHAGCSSGTHVGGADMRVTDVRVAEAPLDSEIANAVIDFSTMTVSMVAVVTDAVVDGEPVVGYGFNSNGRYAQTGILTERLLPRLQSADAAALLDPVDRSPRPGGGAPGRDEQREARRTR